MSAGVYLPDGSYWSAAGWLFEMILRLLSPIVDDETRVHLEGVLRSGVGVLDVRSLSRSVLCALGVDFEPRVVRELVGLDGIDSVDVLEHVRELVRAVRSAEAASPATDPPR